MDRNDRNRSTIDGHHRSSGADIGKQRAFVALLSLVGLGLLISSYAILSAPDFRAQALEIEGITESSPISAEWIEKTVALHPGRDSLFLLGLSPIQERLRANPWVGDAVLERVPPSTLRVAIQFRRPAYLFQGADGSLEYMDERGTVFGHVTPEQGVDYPVVSGLSPQDSEHRLEAIRVLQEWKKAVGQDGVEIFGLPSVEQISWSSEQGYRLIVAENPTSGSYRQKMAVELGPWSPLEFPVQLSRLQSVLKYIREHQVPVRQIWADSGKKIVVKVGRGS